jgi:ribosomal protein L11 methylase PrmA
VVERMLRLANVQSTDVVYDLGCGDGRLVIAAAKTHASRGVGVDLDAQLVEEARRNAARERVAELVRFEQCDALSVDLAPATVVFLYLLHSSMPIVAAHLLRHVRPGTRVVSHSFDVPFLKPTAVDAFMDAAGTPRAIHLWVIE